MGHSGAAFFFESVLMSEASVIDQNSSHRFVGVFRFKLLRAIGPRGVDR